MAQTSKLMQVQVCYARAQEQILLELELEPGTTLERAIRQSGILTLAPEVDLNACKVGVYGKIKPLDAILQEHDRIEIYRPLVADPKEARRRRVAKKENKKAR